jgi:pimeloyl-ACP methyl ester carboxylesterase
MSIRRRPQVYWRAGGRGPALVLLNGWSASGLAWPRSWVRALERDFRVIAVDNRGTGYSRFAPTPFTMPDLADDVSAVLDDAEVDSATVLGISMGGMIAQEVALRHPERVDALMLIATRPPAPAFASPDASESMWGLLRPPGRNETLRVFLKRLWTDATASGFAERHPEAIDELVEQIAERPTPRQMLLHQLRAVNGWGHADRLASIAVPTTVVHGDEDRLLDAENGRRLAALIPGARYVELEGVGHLPPLEAPDATLALIDELDTPAGAAEDAAQAGAA